MKKFWKRFNRKLFNEVVAYGGLGMMLAGVLELVFKPEYNHNSVAMIAAGAVFILIALYEGKK